MTLTPNQLEEDWGYLYEDADAAGSEGVVGFVLVGRCSRDRLQQFPEATSADIAFEVEALFVEPTRLGQGIGQRLFERAREHAARVAPAGALWIQSDPNAEAFYLRCGAVRVGELESASVPGRWLPLLVSSW